MNLAEITACLNRLAISENGVASRIAIILKACERSKNLMIGVYLKEKDRFLYCNDKMNGVIGENHTKLLENGWSFWFSRIAPEEVIGIKRKIIDYFNAPKTEQSLDLRYHLINFEGKLIYVKHEILLHQIERCTLVINYLYDLSDKERIEGCFKIDKNPNRPFTEEQPLNISSREKEVLQLIANGFSSKEIANKLFISNHTAISHRKNLIEKFQVKNTAHLIKKASRLVKL